MRIVFFFFLVLFISSCSSNKQLINEDFEVFLNKSACFGSCPVYKLTIDDKGIAIFDGKRFTDKLGKHSLSLSKLELTNVATAFEAANLKQYDDVYENNIPDLPLISIGYTNRGSTKIVEGKNERPQAIKDLQGLMENIAQKEGWVNIDSSSNKSAKKAEDIMTEEEEEVEEEETIIDSELVIAFKKGTIISRWMKKYKEFGMYVKRPMADDRSVWIVQFNKTKIAPDAILAKIQADEGVESVAFNKVEKEKDK